MASEKEQAARYKRLEDIHKAKYKHDKSFFQNGIKDKRLYYGWYMIAVFCSAKYLVRSCFYAMWDDCREHLVAERVNDTPKMKPIRGHYETLEKLKDGAVHVEVNYNDKDYKEASMSYAVIEQTIYSFLSVKGRPLQ